MKQLKFWISIKINEYEAIGATTGFNALYRINLTNGNSVYLNEFPNEKKIEPVLFSSGCCLNRKIVFAPQSGKNIWLYDIDNNKYEQIICPTTISGNFKFFDVIYYDNKCYLFVCNKLCVLELDPDTRDINEFKTPSDTQFFFRKGTKIKNIYYYCSIKGNDLIEFDLNTKQFVIHKIMEGFKGAFSVLSLSEELLFIAPRYCGDHFLMWNATTSECQIIENPYMESTMPNEIAYLYSILARDNIYVFAEMNVPSVKINKFTMKITPIKELQVGINKKIGVYNRTDDFTILGVLEKNNSYFYDYADIIKFDHKTEQFGNYSYTEIVTSDVHHNFLSNQTIFESKEFKLVNYLNQI